MPATEVSHFLFEAKPLWTGQIGSGGVADGTVQTIPLQSASNLDSGDVYVVRLNRVDGNGTKTTNPSANTEVLYGKLSGTNLIESVRGAEGTAQAWEAGTVVEILFTSTHWNKMIEFLEVEHEADGTHDATFVKTTATQTLTNKTIASADNTLTGVALLSGDQTIAGVKTFSSFPVTPSSSPTTDYQVATKKYVDDNAGAGGKYQFIIPGTAVAGTDVAGTWFVPEAGAIESVSLYADTAGDTGSTVVDVNLNGTSVFPTATKPTLTTTGTEDEDVVPDTTAIAQGDKITIDIDSITTTAQQDLYVIIKYS